MPVQAPPLWTKFRKLFSSPSGGCASPRRRFRPELCVLEARLTPSHTYHVTNGATLAAAVQAADTSGHEAKIVLDNPGTYAIPATLMINANVTISGRQENRPDLYIISPAAGVTAGVFNITGGREVTIRYVTIEGGAATGNGGGIDVSGSGVRLELKDVIIERNTATLNGGGIFVAAGSRLDMTDSYILANRATDGGGLFGQFSRDVDIRNDLFSGNTATTDGGGVYLASGKLELSRDMIINNHAGVDGGGLFVDAAVTISLEHDTITLNTAGTAGGGVFNNHGRVRIKDHTTISNNTAPTNPDFSP